MIFCTIAGVILLVLIIYPHCARGITQCEVYVKGQMVDRMCWNQMFNEKEEQALKDYVRMKWGKDCLILINGTGRRWSFYK